MTFRLLSFFPRMTIEKRFPRSPIVATPSINPKDNSGGADILFRASTTIKKAMPTRDKELIRAVKISVRLKPKVCLRVAFWLESFSPTKLNPREITSERLCPASERRARLPESVPPIASARVMPMLISIAHPIFLPLWSCSWSYIRCVPFVLSFPSRKCGLYPEESHSSQSWPRLCDLVKTVFEVLARRSLTSNSE